jgi:NTE family protein
VGVRIGLVLGAGGSAGVAYHGAILGALEAATQWDPRTADIIVGTSRPAGIHRPRRRRGYSGGVVTIYVGEIPLFGDG